MAMPNLGARERDGSMKIRGSPVSRLEIAAQILAGVALLLALHFHLLASLLSGLLVFELVQTLAPRRTSPYLPRRAGKMVVVALLTIVVIAAITGAILGLISLLSTGSEAVPVVMRKMAEVIETARSLLPDWVFSSLPADPDELKSTAATWLREHAGGLQTLGQDVWRSLVHSLVGMVIGGMIAVSHEAGTNDRPAPLSAMLVERARLLGSAFRSVVFAQIRISALNTLLTGIYLLAIVPSMGAQLPLAKTMVAITFLTGLLPVIGNLISNTVIVVISLSVSPLLAVSSLAFLVLIHKLEYFVNARVMGGRIHARAWELLLAMLVMDTMFGIPGLIAAPIYYAYLKKELSVHGLI
jgi:predicted PurR-regulated permease PerM